MECVENEVAMKKADCIHDAFSFDVVVVAEFVVVAAAVVVVAS
jgi:hypothetical protein